MFAVITENAVSQDYSTIVHVQWSGMQHGKGGGVGWGEDGYGMWVGHVHVQCSGVQHGEVQYHLHLYW